MRRNGVPKKKPAGLAIMDLRQEVMVWRIGNPLEAFSMIALFRNSVSFDVLGDKSIQICPTDQ